MGMGCEIIIENNGKLYAPVALDSVVWTLERKGAPGKLAFTVAKDAVIDFQEGNPVRMDAGGAGLFYGFVFSKKRDKKHHIAVTAYDQLRYLKNKDILCYENQTASDVVKTIIGKYKLNPGDIDQTEFVIASRKEKDTPLFDIIYNALDQELVNKQKMYVLYDDFGKLALKSVERMKLDVLIDGSAGENFDYQTSIDDATYNQVKLTYENRETGAWDTYIARDGSHINEWGLLQLTESIQEGENGQAKADALLGLYNMKTRKLKVSKVFGDARVRAGCLVPVTLGVGDIDVKNYMLVEKCVHTFNGGRHTMDLTLRGGEFIA